MHFFKVKLIVFLICLAGFGVVIISQTQPSRGQSQDSMRPVAKPTAKPLRKNTSDVRETRPEKLTEDSTRASAFAHAAASNAQLSKDLKWTFGGKQQNGWYIYRPLIERLLGTEANAASEQFALALSRWQAKFGLAPNGVLDEQTLYAMITKWQDDRLKERVYPSPDQLVVAPNSEFYDPTRPDELRQVERETYAAYHRMIAAAAADRSLNLTAGADGKLAPTEKYLKLISTFRTREYQEKLRRDFPTAGRAGLALNSPHFTGRALDLYVGGDPVESKDPNRAIQVQTPVYQWLVRNAERFGFRPYFYEPWHWEYVK
jgi:zinc D-Ala-D-Ala carboxypeptidase